MFLFVCGVLCLERWNWDVGKEKKKKTFNFFFSLFLVTKMFLSAFRFKQGRNETIDKPQGWKGYFEAQILAGTVSSSLLFLRCCPLPHGCQRIQTHRERDRWWARITLIKGVPLFLSFEVGIKRQKKGVLFCLYQKQGVWAQTAIL